MLGLWGEGGGKDNYLMTKHALPDKGVGFEASLAPLPIRWDKKIFLNL